MLIITSSCVEKYFIDFWIMKTTMLVNFLDERGSGR
ncbi:MULTISPECIES: heterocyst-inhibiting signaling peptide PatS [unclassified Anabaena]